MLWEIIFLLAAFHGYSTVNGSPLRMPDNATCYNSSDPVALNTSQLYDDLSAAGQLWNREDEQKPLPSCSDIWNLLSDHTCAVCRDEQVFAVCQNLSESAVLRMEDSLGHIIRNSRCACDQLFKKAEIPTSAPTTAPPAPTPTPAGNKLHWPVPTVVVFIFIIVVAVIFHRYQRRKRRSDDKQAPEAAAMKEPLNGAPLTDV
ncbi:hypothetical protein OJAV_G00034420 [Oryzias javanicus]|uniref:Uncharacterized protein n=1 Tax=Oryzias javanicus TaxID=123683 RepID=A0A3S2N562_ORYJA|nr:hypothetical protein OJAV_G00034420 [Oryzias javanicus]